MVSADRSARYAPSSRKIGGLGRWGLGFFLVGLLFFHPATASASPDTLRRAFSNILMGPMDMILSPIVAVQTAARNLADVDDTPAVRVVYAVPGVIWLTGLNFGSGAIRIITGGLETVPGVLVFPFETDLDPLFDPVEDAPALIDWENPLVDVENPWVYYNPLVAPFAFNVRCGLNYTESDY